MLQQKLEMLIDVEREVLPLGTLNPIGRYSLYLQAVPPKELNGEVQTGTRMSDKEWNAAKKQRIKQWYKDTAAANKMPLVQPIWSVWYDSDPASWPKELRNFWFSMNSRIIDERGTIVQSMRTNYPNDEKLLECANFIEYWTDQGVQISHKGKYRIFGLWQDVILYVVAIYTAAAALKLLAALSVVVYRTFH
eukprot:11952-Heterococcus_DN1.PRE.2